jgi:hypothetical protein
MRDKVIQQLSLHLHIGSCLSSKASLKSRFDKGVFDGNGRHTISPRDDDMGQAEALGTESGTQTSRRRLFYVPRAKLRLLCTVLVKCTEAR